MLIKFENNLLSFGLLLMLYHLRVKAAVVKPLKNSPFSQQKQEVVPLTAGNVQNNVFNPMMSPTNQGPFYGPYFNEAPAPDSTYMNNDDNYPLDQRLPVENPDYQYYAENENPSRGHHYDHHPNRNLDRSHRTTKKPKKIYKAIERVYYYPHSDSEMSKNKNAMNQMKDFIPEDHNDDDSEDENHETDDVEPRKDYQQMNENPPRGEHEEPEEVYASDGTGTQGSIANDVKQFGREAVDDAKSFESFLDNLRHFADKSEKEYSSPSEKMDSEEEVPNIDGLIDSDEEIPNPPRYSDSMAAQHHTDDRANDYEKVSNYGNPMDYDSEKNSYQNQQDQMNREQRGGHRYHKDRRRPKKSNAESDEEYEKRNREVSGLIDSEPEEGDYLSNFDVVKQMKNSEAKYNTGIDPVYSSQRDFDEVHRLEKMIENVALLNKQKERAASMSHDNNESTEGSESKTKITKIEKKDDDKETQSEK